MAREMIPNRHGGLVPSPSDDSFWCEIDMDASTAPDLAGAILAPDNSFQPPRHQALYHAPAKRSGTPADKEHKRLKRLLRNRVSAQQARERRKAYIHSLETKTGELERKNEELEERVSILQRENQMLRQIVKNTTMNKNLRSKTSGGEIFDG